MKIRAAILTCKQAAPASVISCFAIGLCFLPAVWAGGPNDATLTCKQALPVAAAVALATFSGDESTYSYVGNKKCKKCHIKEYKSWEKTRMGKAFEILRPGNHAEAKEKFHLEVDKDYTTDKKCLKCHTVGYGESGGYAIPVPADKKAVRKAKKLQGVGCESCHGPGSAYIKVFEEIMKSKRKYKVEELYAVGLQRINEATCTICHNEESPSVNPGDPFDYEKRKDEGTHEHHELKQRE